LINVQTSAIIQSSAQSMNTDWQQNRKTIQCWIKSFLLFFGQNVFSMIQNILI